jgi:hypothetical protein
MIIGSDSEDAGNVSSEYEEGAGSDCEGGHNTLSEDGESDTDW